jgi:hypothetical protein
MARVYHKSSRIDTVARLFSGAPGGRPQPQLGKNSEIFSFSSFHRQSPIPFLTRAQLSTQKGADLLGWPSGRAEGGEARNLAGNQFCSKPYCYGGGHRSFDDVGYDCSGTISYVLGAAGLISSPMSSTEFRRYGKRGRGKWIPIYARDGHTFAVIAGLQLDTTPYDNYTGRWAPRWQTTDPPPQGFESRHPVGL